MIDLLYLTFNRLAFTQASCAALLANTNWNRVGRLIIYDDGSTDGTLEFIQKQKYPVPTEIRTQSFRWASPVEVMKHFLSPDTADVFAKLDSDCLCPSGWLDSALAVMDRRPELSLLGIEPPSSTIHIELGSANGKGYALTNSIGGLGLMRSRCFEGADKMRAHSIYGGFTDWQNRHPEVTKGWLSPALQMPLLDRLPMEPWKSLSQEYIAKGWQRPWKNYSEADSHLWEWWARA